MASGTSRRQLPKRVHCVGQRMRPLARLLFGSSWPQRCRRPSHVTKRVKAKHLNATSSVGQDKHLGTTRRHAAGHACDRLAHAGQRTNRHDAQAPATAPRWAHHATTGAPGVASCRNGRSGGASRSHSPTDWLVVAASHGVVIPFVNLPPTPPHMNAQ